MILVIVSLVRAGVYAAINTTGAEPNVCLLIYLHSAEVIMSGSVPAFRLAGPFTMSFLIIFFFVTALRLARYSYRTDLLDRLNIPSAPRGLAFAEPRSNRTAR